MGLFAHWLVARGATAARLRRLGLDPADGETGPGWRYAFGEQVPDDLGALVERAAGAGSGAAIGVWIADSDFAQVVGVGDRGRGAVAIGVPPEWEEPLEHDPDAFAAWSTCAPTTLSAAEVEEIVAGDFVFAEAVADELFERLGLPAPYDPLARPDARNQPLPPRATVESIDAAGFGGYVGPFGWMHDLGYVEPEHVPWRELRHVPGVGEGFLGIWDREAPGAPLATFTSTPRGEARLRDELERLQAPVRVEVVGAAGFGGFREVLGRAQLQIANRRLTYRDARFVPGRGDGFVGIWDRRSPAAPVERFPDTRDGERRGRERLHELLLEDELASKATHGLRLYRERTPSRMVDVELPEGARFPPEIRSLFDEARRERRLTRTPGAQWLLLEEDEDERWRPLGLHSDGRLYLYSAGLGGEPLTCSGRFESVEAAHAEVARVEREPGEWHELPETVPRTLLGALRWVQRELAGGTGVWYERFGVADESVELHGALSFARVFEAGVPVAALLVAEGGPGEDAVLHLLRPNDASRLVYGVEDAAALRAIAELYLGDVELGEWRSLAEAWPRDLRSLGRAVLALAGIVEP